MSSDQQTLASTGQFHHRGHPGDCTCPIHRDRERGPFTAPLGLRFSDHVGVERITRGQARDIYESHHGYMSGVPSVNLAHHGLTYQDNLVGAITYRYPLLSRKAVFLDSDGALIPRPRSREDVREELPQELHRTALDILSMDRTDEADVARDPVLDGDAFVEAARICLGVRMANLASASLARSQEKFITGPACDSSVEYLLTFVRSDYDAAMVRALRDKGWTCVGWTDPRKPGNRPDRPIHERHKWVFLCPVSRVQEQASLGRWSA